MSSSTLLTKFMFPPPLFVVATSIFSFTTLAIAGLSEVQRGQYEPCQYSKFFEAQFNPATEAKLKVSRRYGMVMLYIPAFATALSALLIMPNESSRFLSLKSAITIHFMKRILESLFVHKYSREEMALETATVTLFGYLEATLFMIISQNYTIGLPEPSFDLREPGIRLFLVGISGNFYHHVLLANLRGKGDKAYKIPRGGLFDFVVCPHYLFEIMGIWGFALISQTLYTASFAVGTTFYLTGRSIAYRRWYPKKFDDFPKRVKAIIPFVL